MSLPTRDEIKQKIITFQILLDIPGADQVQLVDLWLELHDDVEAFLANDDRVDLHTFQIQMKLLNRLQRNMKVLWIKSGRNPKIFDQRIANNNRLQG